MCRKAYLHCWGASTWGPSGSPRPPPGPLLGPLPGPLLGPPPPQPTLGTSACVEGPSWSPSRGCSLLGATGGGVNGNWMEGDVCPNRTHCLMHLASPKSIMVRMQNHAMQSTSIALHIHVCLICRICMPYIFMCMPYIYILCACPIMLYLFVFWTGFLDFWLPG